MSDTTDQSDAPNSPGPSNEESKLQQPKRVVEFAGPYRLMETLGKGGLATVKVGVDLMTGVRVAVKIVDKEKLSNPREQISMAREITIMKLLRHKNILRLYDIYENEEKIFLILDIYEGGDLYSLLTTQGALRPSEAVGLFRQLIEAVDFCHKHLIVHRDLKPENLLLSRDKKALALSDFGLSTGMQGSRNFLKTRCGTVHYISPEVAKGESYVGMASDVWSCGIILYAMVTASLPFDGPNSIAVLKKIVKGEYTIPANLPPELQDLVRKMLHLEPQQRITMSQIKQHPWYRFSLEKESLESPKREAPVENMVLTGDDLHENADILENLHLLGWEDGELQENLVSPDMNMAKMFYGLLMQHKKREIEYQQQQQKQMKSKTPTQPLSQSHHGSLQAIKEKEHKVKPPKEGLGMSVGSSTTTASSSSSSASTSSASAPATPSASTASAPASPMTSSPDSSEVLSPTARAVRRKSQKEKRVILRKKSGAKGSFDRERSSTLGEDERNPNSRQTRSATVGDGIRPSVEARSPSANRTLISGSSGNSFDTENSTSSSNLGSSGTSMSRRLWWLTKPSGDPNSKMYRLESTKNITEILSQLKGCFGDLELDVTEKQTKSGAIKVKASPNSSPAQGQTKKKKTTLKVEMIPTEGGSVNVKFKKGQGADQEDFQETMKKLEETLSG